MKITVPCQAGSYKDSGMSKCAKCQGNKISSERGAEICTECSAGSAANADKTECGKFYFCAFELFQAFRSRQRVAIVELQIQSES